MKNDPEFLHCTFCGEYFPLRAAAQDEGGALCPACGRGDDIEEAGHIHPASRAARMLAEYACLPGGLDTESDEPCNCDQALSLMAALRALLHASAATGGGSASMLSESRNAARDELARWTAVAEDETHCAHCGAEHSVTQSKLRHAARIANE